MKEKLGELTKSSLEKMLEWAKTTEDFVAEQAPLLVQEMLNYALFFHGFTIVICIVALYSCILICKSIYKGLGDTDSAWYRTNTDENPLGIFCFIFSVGGIIASSIILVINCFLFAKVWIAPRLYIIEELMSIVRYNT